LITVLAGPGATGIPSTLAGSGHARGWSALVRPRHVRVLVAEDNVVN
jgi:hypothetical protein